MPTKKKSPVEKVEAVVDASLNAAQNSLGAIKINPDVVANIVRVAASEIEGVYSVGGGSGFREEIAGIFTRKESQSATGIQIEEDTDGRYLISLKVTLIFGVELAKAAKEVQEAVKTQVSRMTNREVAQVDVVIDGIKMPEQEVAEDQP